MAARVRWPELVVASGLAAAITAIGGLASDASRVGGEAARQRCEIASSILQDETPNPYVTEQAKRQITIWATARLARCLKD